MQDRLLHPTQCSSGCQYFQSVRSHIFYVCDLLYKIRIKAVSMNVMIRTMFYQFRLLSEKFLYDSGDTILLKIVFLSE